MRWAGCICALLIVNSAMAQEAIWSVDFSKEQQGGRRFLKATEFVEIQLRHKLDGIKAMTVGGWFYPLRCGEQCFLFRGEPEAGPQGERMFRRQEKWVN